MSVQTISHSLQFSPKTAAVAVEILRFFPFFFFFLLLTEYIPCSPSSSQIENYLFSAIQPLFICILF